MNYLYLTIFLLIPMLISAQAEEQVKAEVLKQDTVNWDGGPIAYPSGQAEISVLKVSIPAGSKTALHCHPVPIAAYILSGSVEVITKAGHSHTFNAGDALIEVMNQWHTGYGVSDELTEIIVFYAGAKDVPRSVLESHTPKEEMLGCATS